MRKTRPRVSVGMPVFNGEQFLEKALDSLIAQDLDGFEIIISDNASTDRTGEICQDYASKDERIRYYRNGRNLGAAYNYNRVFYLSSGDYFKWAAHDDECAPNFLRACVETLQSAPRTVVLCYPRARFIDENGKIIGNDTDNLDIRSRGPVERLRQVVKRINLASAVFGVIRSSALRQTRLIGNYIASDYVLMAELALLGEFWEVPEYLSFRRMHPGASRSANRTNKDVTLWFDTAKSGRLILSPRARLVVEWLNSVRKSDLSLFTKTLCCFAVPVDWYWRRARARGGQLKDLLKTLGAPN